jgi:UrcA family protein
MRRPENKLAIPCVALAVLLSPLSAVAAQPGYEVARRTVNFADLDLTRRDGIATLYSRIKSAANEVCEPVDSRTFESLVRVQRCKEQAISRAVMDVKSSQLTTFHMAMTNQADVTLVR